jgi:hypothetical protein
MPNMRLSTSTRSIVDKSDLHNSKKTHAASQAVMSTPLWTKAATAGEVTKHAEDPLSISTYWLLGPVGVSILVFVPTNIRGLCVGWIYQHHCEEGRGQMALL